MNVSKILTYVDQKRSAKIWKGPLNATVKKAFKETVQVKIAKVQLLIMITRNIMKNNGFITIRIYFLLHFYNTVLPLDINECEDLTLNNCPENTNCRNLNGNYTCNCKAGFQENGSSCEGNSIMLENHSLIQIYIGLFH